MLGGLQVSKGLLQRRYRELQILGNHKHNLSPATALSCLLGKHNVMMTWVTSYTDRLNPI